MKVIYSTTAKGGVFRGLNFNAIESVEKSTESLDAYFLTYKTVDNYTGFNSRKSKKI